MIKKTVVLIMILFLFSCQSSTDKERLIITNITGEFNDVLVVMDSFLWNQDAGKEIKEVLEYPYMVLPEYESSFKVIHIEHENLTNIFQLYRNIIIVDIDSKNKKSTIWYGKDVYAKTQAFIKIKAKNMIELKSLIKKNEEKIRYYFHQSEIKRLQDSYRNHISSDIVKKVRQKFNIKINIPANYKLFTDTTNFVWISFETPDMTQSIIIYSRPYINVSQWKKDYLINYRNFIANKYIPGPKENSYMTTEKEMPIEYLSGQDSLQNYYAITKGLWKVKNDFMGGPFISYSILNKKKDKLITIEGFVYNPKKDKRKYMMQLEAIIKTARTK